MRYEQYLECLGKEIAATKPERVILSSEIFWVGQCYRAFQHRRALLEPYFSDVRLVTYLRRVDSYIVSANKQVFEDTVPEYACWYPNIRQWLRVLSCFEHIVRPYEKQQLVAGDVIRDFVDILGLDGTRLRYPVRRVNRSIPLENLGCIDIQPPAAFGKNPN